MNGNNETTPNAPPFVQTYPLADVMIERIVDPLLTGWLQRGNDSWTWLSAWWSGRNEVREPVECRTGHVGAAVECCDGGGQTTRPECQWHSGRDTRSRT